MLSRVLFEVRRRGSVNEHAHETLCTLLHNGSQSLVGVHKRQHQVLDFKSGIGDKKEKKGL